MQTQPSFAAEHSTDSDGFPEAVEVQPRTYLHHDVVITECQDPAQAELLAARDANNTGSWSIPVIMTRQGSRHSFMGAISMGRVLNFVLLNRSARKGAKIAEVQKSINRPVVKDHVAHIRNYLLQNALTYILPPVTLNVQAKINVYRGATTSGVSVAYMVLPTTESVATTDGQHRLLAVGEAAAQMRPEDRDRFNKDSIGFMLTCENNIERVHQDFVDASRTKPLPPAMLTAFDTRNPANRLVNRLVSTCAVFKDKTDMMGKNLSKTSAFLFGGNMVRQMVKAFLSNNQSMGDDAFGPRVLKMMPDEATEQREFERLVAYIDFLSVHMEGWREAAQLEGTEVNQVTRLRNRGLLNITATGLVLLGKLGYELFYCDNKSLKNGDWKIYAERAAQQDWHKTGPLWSDIIRPGLDDNGQQRYDKEGKPLVKFDGRTGPVNLAIRKLLVKIDLPLPEQAQIDLPMPEPAPAMENVPAA